MNMSRERAVWALAGTMVLLSQALAHLLSPWWHLLSLFVGLNLLQSAFTGFCPLAKILKALGCRPGTLYA